MATVKIPPVLRPSTNGEKEIDATGDNVGAVLNALAEQHPATKGQLFSDDGDLNRYVNVYLNDEDVRVLDGLQTPVGERDTLVRSEEHTSELQSRQYLVCRLLLEKKKKTLT